MSDAPHSMHPDHENLETLLTTAQQLTVKFHNDINERSPAQFGETSVNSGALPEGGIGGAAALQAFEVEHLARHSTSAGPRYLGFVTGGTSPAALWPVIGLPQPLIRTQRHPVTPLRYRLPYKRLDG